MVIANPDDSVALVRSRAMHVLLAAGRNALDFRLRLSGEFLKNALTLAVCPARCIAGA